MSVGAQTHFALAGRGVFFASVRPEPVVAPTQWFVGFPYGERIGANLSILRDASYQRHSTRAKPSTSSRAPGHANAWVLCVSIDAFRSDRSDL